MSKIIDGLQIADEHKKELARAAHKLEEATGVKPGLAAIRIGEDPVSQLYVRLKGTQAEEIGYHFEEHVFPSWTSVESIKNKIQELNFDDQIHGIIVQLPLPSELNKFEILSLIDPMKDVDGLHPLNAGKLFQGIKDGLVASTPLGCLRLIETIHPTMEGLNVTVIGASILVGRPMALLMLQQNCTVSIAHLKTRNLPSLCETADILIVAIGNPEFIKGEWIKEGATVIDVGINRLPSGKIVGDVDFISADRKAGAITPVPGGVGPMTVACLLENTLKAAHFYASYPFPIH